MDPPDETLPRDDALGRVLCPNDFSVGRHDTLKPRWCQAFVRRNLLKNRDLNELPNIG